MLKQYKIQCRMNKKYSWFDYREECNDSVFITTFLDVCKCRYKQLKEQFPGCEWRIVFCHAPEWFEYQGEI